MNDLEAFARLVQALAPWRRQLIFIGGGHRLHRLDRRANQPDYQPVFTRDTDLAFANTEPMEGDIKQALMQHGFQEELSGDHRPPAAHYTLGDEAGGFYAEFLTPLAGSGYKRGACLMRLWRRRVFQLRRSDTWTFFSSILGGSALDTMTAFSCRSEWTSRWSTPCVSWSRNS